MPNEENMIINNPIPKIFFGCFNMLFPKLLMIFSIMLGLDKAFFEKSHFFKFIKAGNNVHDKIHAQIIPNAMVIFINILRAN